MKPTFALDLTRESIGLLHRTPKGWLSLGEVAFDAPDLAEALDYLRKTALGLSPMGIATKVVLPNSQILYTEVNAPGPTREEKRRQIMAALEGRTPYDVADLVFDWSGKGATVMVAVVARETLAEAEAFATEHRLNPVSFVGIPEDGNFNGEPWFGPTEAAASILAKGETVDRDREAITILHRDLPVAEKPVADKPVEVAPEPGPQALPETPPEPAREPEQTAEPVAVAPDPQTVLPPVTEEDPLPGLEEALSADLKTDIPPPPSAPVESFGDDDIEADDLIPPALAAATSRMPEPVEPPTSPAAAPAATLPEVEEAPFAHVTDTSAFPETDDDLRPAAPGKGMTASDLDDDLPPAPPSAAMVAFASRRAGATPPISDAAAQSDAPPRPLGKPVEDLPPIPPRPSPSAARPQPAAISRPAPAKGFGGLVTAPTIPGTRKVKGKGLTMGEVPRPPGIAAAGAKTLTKPGGTFGARAPQRGKPRFLGLILTALLLVFLALVAAWSSMYLAQGNQAEENPTLAATSDALPDVNDEMLADMQDPEGMTGPLPEAEGEDGPALAQTLATEPASELVPEPEVATETVAPAEPAETDVAAAEPAPPEPAPETAVTTDLVAAQAPAEEQDEIILSAMDMPPPALDSLALPVPQAVADASPDTPVPPPPFGTVYQFDASGLLKPTPDGILSPEGVFLIAGKPPLLPPTRSDAAVAAAEAAAALSATPAPATTAPATSPEGSASLTVLPTEAPEQAAEAAPAAADPAMAGFRPRPRPEGLAPASDDDAALDTAAPTEFAGPRPLPRPETVLAAAAAARPAVTPPTVDLGAQGASLTAQREAQLAAAAAAEAANPSVVAISRRPASRPRDLSRAVEAAVAAAVREPAPELVAAAAAPAAKPEEIDELDEPEVVTAAPRIPTRANVAKQATFANAINLSKTNLIGVYGSPSKRYALIRQSNGRYKKVRVGDKIDGGTIQAITENEVRYQKGGRLIALQMPRA